jgi:hypothetical protein
MASLKRHEGYFLSDNRVSGGALIERAVIVCSHCQRAMFRNPARTRERGYCGKCDHYLCDPCEAIRVETGECKPFRQVIDETQERAFLALNLSQV